VESLHKITWSSPAQDICPCPICLPVHFQQRGCVWSSHQHSTILSVKPSWCGHWDLTLVHTSLTLRHGGVQHFLQTEFIKATTASIDPVTTDQASSPSPHTQPNKHYLTLQHRIFIKSVFHLCILITYDYVKMAEPTQPRSSFSSFPEFTNLAFFHLPSCFPRNHPGLLQMGSAAEPLNKRCPLSVLAGFLCLPFQVGCPVQ
jgi:hypothetical protein